MTQRVIIAGGGTGGHIFPGLAVADALRARAPELEVVWVGGTHGQEGRLVPAHGLTLHTVTAARIVGGSPVAKLRGAAAVPVGVLQALWLLLRLRPIAVLGVGGYASAAVGFAAWLLRIPLVLQEQNARPGRTNRSLGRFARRIAVAFDEARPYFPEGRTVLTGNPVRAAIRDLPPVATDPTAARRVLVVGGSQGARFLNENVPGLLARVRDAGVPVAVRHQTGTADLDATRARYETLGLAAEVTPFIADMAAAYADADLVVGRAGATTIAELQVAGRPALLVPFPFAADDHQAANAGALVDAGAALMVRQEAFDAAALATTLVETLAPARLSAMADAARARARADAADAVAALVLHVARGAKALGSEVAA